MNDNQLELREMLQTKEYQIALKRFENVLHEETDYLNCSEPFYTDYDELQHRLARDYKESVAIEIMEAYINESREDIIVQLDDQGVGFEDKENPQIIPRIKAFNEQMLERIKRDPGYGVLPNLDYANQMLKYASEKLEETIYNWRASMFTLDDLGYVVNYDGKPLTLAQLDEDVCDSNTTVDEVWNSIHMGTIRKFL